MPDESRIHLLTNGITDRQKAKLGAQNVTIAELMQALADERAEHERMVKWYMQQIPGLVAQMLGDALAMNGLTMQGPTRESASPEPVADAGDGAVDLR